MKTDRSPHWGVFAFVAVVSCIIGTSMGCSGTEGNGLGPDGGSAGGSDGGACGKTTCNGSCVDTMVDPGNCGSCGTRCADGQVCSGGTCALTCGGGTTKCGDRCVDTNVDNANCGVCTNVCPGGTSCKAGECRQTCSVGESVCTPEAGAAYCAKLEADRDNCGSCGHSCEAGEICVGGSCTLSCQAGLVDCSGTCVDPMTNPKFCGASGSCGAGGGSAGTVCPETHACFKGSCIEVLCGGTCAPDACVNHAGCGKRVFITSETVSGNMGGLAGADAFCQARAQAAGLPGTYRAWLSDATGSPATRFTRSTTLPYRLVDGTLVAKDWSDLVDGSIAHAIDKTELNGPPPPSTACENKPAAWSNTRANGNKYVDSFSCSNWTATVNGSMWGNAGVTHSMWSDWCTAGSCGWTASLYCFEQ